MICKTFPADHTEFYEEFEVWRKESLNKKLPEEGVYILYAGTPIDRFLKKDPKGILYIGKGIILPYHNRIGKFINAINDTEKGSHKGGDRFYLIQKVKDRFPISNMKVEIQLTDNSKEQEKDLLDEYYSTYGDTPPLNRII